MNKPKLAIVGIQGLPNNYGGFETLAENLVKYLSEDFDITVYCSNEVEKQKDSMYLGAKLKYINVSSHGAKGIIYDSLSLLDAVRSSFDCILILGFGPGFVMPFLPRKIKNKIVLNFGGLDWKRDKWGKFAQKIIQTCEKFLVRNSHTVISDNLKIKEYVTETYAKDSALIAYGGDQATILPITEEHTEKYPFLKKKYVFEVARIQSDNNIEMLIKAFIAANKYPLVLVGNWKASEYGIQLKAKYEQLKNKNLILLNAIYDRSILDVLRSNCYFYVHGHSAGGTNPSLCEAMFLALPIVAFSNGYNEETTNHKALYFKDEEDLKNLILSIKDDQLNNMKMNLKQIADKDYRWEAIALRYKKEFQNIIGY